MLSWCVLLLYGLGVCGLFGVYVCVCCVMSCVWGMLGGCLVHVFCMFGVCVCLLCVWLCLVHVFGMFLALACFVCCLVCAWYVVGVCLLCSGGVLDVCDWVVCEHDCMCVWLCVC